MFIFWSETQNVYLQEIRESDNPEENWGRISQISQMKNLKGKHWDTSLSREKSGLVVAFRVTAFNSLDLVYTTRIHFYPPGLIVDNLLWKSDSASSQIPRDNYSVEAVILKESV